MDPRIDRGTVPESSGNALPRCCGLTMCVRCGSVRVWRINRLSYDRCLVRELAGVLELRHGSALLGTVPSGTKVLAIRGVQSAVFFELVL